MIRLFDIIFALCGIILIAPLFIPIMIMLKLTGEGYIFYGQERVGQYGKKFKIFKFATMLKDSPKMRNAYITMREDPRVLPFGKFLRKTKLNELPQLFNVLIGDLSLVGPRPQVQSHIELYPTEKVDEILSIKPGITGIASIFFRDEEAMVSRSDLDPKDFYRKFIAPYKVELEIWFKNHRSIITYFLLIGLTVWSILFSRSKLHERIFKDLPEPPSELVL